MSETVDLRLKTIAISPDVHSLCERARDVINGERARTGVEKRLTMKAYYEQQLREAAEKIIGASSAEPMSH